MDKAPRNVLSKHAHPTPWGTNETYEQHDETGGPTPRAGEDGRVRPLIHDENDPDERQVAAEGWGSLFDDANENDDL